MKRFGWLALVGAALATNAGAVSVMEIAGKCGDDAKVWCEDVGYGDEMTECLVEHRSELASACKVIVDRVAEGEDVTLF